MGLLDLYARTAGTTDTPLQAVPSTLGERVAATAGETFAPDRYFMINRSRRDLWQRAVDELQGATGQALPNPYDPATHEEMMRLFNEPAVQEERRNRVIEASRMARAQGYEDLFDPENIDRYIGEEANRLRGRARDLEGTGNGFLNFLAGAALESATPHGAVGFLIPGTRLAGAVGVARSFLGNVAKEALVQAGTNAGLQAAAEGLDYMARRQTGTEQTFGEMATNVAGAAVFGGALGGGARALHLKWLGLPEKVRADAPLEVRDAFRVVEADAIYGGQNRLGVPWGVHERYLDSASDAILRGRPVDLAGLARNADTAWTAVGRALAPTPGVEMPNIAALGAAADRARMLPDAELEPFARQVKPSSFVALDAADARLRALDERVAAIRTEAEQIGITDVADIDSAARLQDIETRLQAKGLRRQVRESLEQEREMIRQSLGPELDSQLVTMRKEFFPEHAAALRQIEDERAAILKERSLALGEAQREIDFLRGKLDKIVVNSADPPATALELGFAAPKDLADAIARADLLRQATIFRETLPAGGGFDRPAATPSPKAAEMPPEMVKALETETARLVEARPDLEVSIGGRTSTAKEALDDADRMVKDAQAALGCAIGAL